jgi:hypothetical protein
MPMQLLSGYHSLTNRRVVAILPSVTTDGGLWEESLGMTQRNGGDREPSSLEAALEPLTYSPTLVKGEAEGV